MDEKDAIRFLVTLGVEYAQTFKDGGKPVVQETLMLRISAAAEALQKAVTGGSNGDHKG